jgi:hypothetical protein
MVPAYDRGRCGRVCDWHRRPTGIPKASDWSTLACQPPIRNARQYTWEKIACLTKRAR